MLVAAVKLAVPRPNLPNELQINLTLDTVILKAMEDDFPVKRPTESPVSHFFAKHYVHIAER